MTTTREMVLIGGVVRALSERGNWCGETHIQKTAYLAKHMLGVDFECEFVLYKHGPYSFDLSKSISHMKVRGVLGLSPNPGYGPSYILNEQYWSALNRATDNVFDKYKERVNKICDVMAKKNVADMEKVATAYFVMRSFPDSSDAEWARKLSEIKPHIPIESAIPAVAEAKRMSS